VDRNIHDVPVNFLTTNDSTGGNSGSPVLNAKGELIGLLFDGTYEAMYSDYYFNPKLTRSINVDIRYVLFIAEKVDKALNVLEELTIVR
jgi:S1-C subfamily serine protease